MKKHSLNTMKTLSIILAILFIVIAVSHANTNSNDDQHLSLSSSNLGRNPLIQTSDLDLTELLNRRRVNLRNRFRVPLTRFSRNIPRRCRHQRFTTFGPGVRVDPSDDMATIMRKQAEVIRHRHVAGKDAVEYEVKEEYDGEWKAGRPHHHHHHHDRDDEGHKVHHDEIRDHGYNHHGHYNKKKGNYIIGKIRKFLSFF